MFRRQSLFNSPLKFTNNFMRTKNVEDEPVVNKNKLNMKLIIFNYYITLS
jgi:hypothetical protein